jgi:hypothetical protein
MKTIPNSCPRSSHSSGPLVWTANPAAARLLHGIARTIFIVSTLTVQTWASRTITDPNAIDTILGYLDGFGLSFSFLSQGYVGLSGGSNASPPDGDENNHVKLLRDRDREWQVEFNPN